MIALDSLNRNPTNRSPLKAIRRHCLECSGGSQAERRLCPCRGCNLHPFRHGHRLPKMPEDATEPHVRGGVATLDPAAGKSTGVGVLA